MRSKKEDLCTLLHAIERILGDYIACRKSYSNAELVNSPSKETKPAVLEIRDRVLCKKKYDTANRAQAKVTALRKAVNVMSDTPELDEPKVFSSLLTILSNLKNDARDLDIEHGKLHTSYNENATLFGSGFKALCKTTLTQSSLINHIDECESIVGVFRKRHFSLVAEGIPLENNNALGYQ
ncbi:MAG: hypothetical protein NTU49_10530 [Gammaproteobacteria bacterium]|nr:hypothetical protein [Gammaproteobacteria bacterium]